MSRGSFISRPEASENISEYAPRGSSEFYRHGRAGAALGEGSAPKGDLSRLRQALGPEPEVVHVPQPGRRLGWFAAGFAIALAFGVGIGWLVIAGLPAITGKGSSPQTAENSKPPQEASAPAAAVPAAPTAPRVAQSSAPSTAAPAAATSPQLASAPAPSAPAPSVWNVRTVQRSDQGTRPEYEARYRGGIQRGQCEWRRIRPQASARRSRRRLRAVAHHRHHDATLEKDQVFGLIGNVGMPTAAVALPYALDRRMLFFGAFTGAGLLRSAILPIAMRSITAPATPKKLPLWLRW